VLAVNEGDEPFFLSYVFDLAAARFLAGIDSHYPGGAHSLGIPQSGFVPVATCPLARGIDPVAVAQFAFEPV
jgi:hypothetical protein